MAVGRGGRTRLRGRDLYGCDLRILGYKKLGTNDEIHLILTSVELETLEQLRDHLVRHRSDDSGGFRRSRNS